MLSSYLNLPVFSIAIRLALASTRDHTHYWLFELSALIGQYLNSYSTFDTLFPSFIVYSWYHVYSGVDGQLTAEAILMYAHHAQQIHVHTHNITLTKGLEIEL